MMDDRKMKCLKPSPITGHYHDVIGEAFLLEKDGKKSLNTFPKAYQVKFFIFLRPEEKVKEIEFPVLKHGDGAVEDTIIQSINIVTSNRDPVARAGKGHWEGYEFPITKEMSELLILEFSVNGAETDPKPKVIYEDPLEIDPGDGTGH